MKSISRETLTTMIRDFRIKERYEKFKLDNKENIEFIREAKYIILITSAMLYLLFSIVPVSFIISALVILISGYKLSIQCSKKVIDNGLITYFPQSMKHAFLNRSVLDILCDLWFIPSTSVYIMAAIKPMFDPSISPEEAYKTLDHLEPEQKKFFMTKGLAFLCPRKVKNLLLPKSYQLRGGEDDNVEDGVDSNLSVRGDNVEKNDRSLADLMEELDCNVPVPVRMRKYSEGGVKLYEKNTTEKVRKKGGYVLEKEVNVQTKLVKDNDKKTISVWKKNTAATEGKSELGLTKEDKTELFNDDSIFLKTQNRQSLDYSMVEDKPLSLVGDKTRPLNYQSPKKKRSRVILSSEWMNAMRKAPGRVDPKWDNYELYKNKHQPKKDNSAQPSSGIDKKLQILKMILDLKNGQFVKNVDNKALISVGSISLSVLVLQLMFSRKVRRWSKQTLLFLLYILGSGAFVGSLALILVKMRGGNDKKSLTNKDEKTKGK